MRKKKKRNVSRLNKIKHKQEIRQAVVYVLLTIFLVVSLFIWGIPAIAKLAGVFVDNKEAPQLSNQAELPVTTPFLNDIPEATNSATLNINGTTESGVEVEIYLNNLKVDQVLSDKEGNFSAQVELKEGNNWLYAQAKRGKEVSPKSKTYQILLDRTAPKITILEPADGKTEFNGDQEKTITIAGETDKEIDSARIGDRIAIIEDGKKFKTEYTLNEGDNNIKIVVKDKAGNEAKTDLKLVWRP